MIIIKNHDEMEKIKKVGLKLGKVFDELSELIKPGLSTLQISEYCEKLLAKEGCKPTFKGYDGFSGAVCTSRNETLIHGIPSKHEILQEGDIISIDMGNVDETGFQGDACRTFPVGNISAEAKELIRCSEECFYEAYKIWCEDNALHALAANRLSSELAQNEKRYNVEATNNIYLAGGKRVRGFVGIEVLVRPSF